MTSFKKIIAAVLFICGSAAVCLAQQNPQVLFDHANQQLKSHQYTKAIALYKDIEAQHTVSGALFLNLGIAYQRIDSLGKAKYYFLKAEQFDATEAKANQGLEFLETQFSRQSAVLPKLPWDVATHWLQNNVGSTFLLALGVILLNLGILIYIIHWFIQWNSKYLKLTGYIVSGLAVLAISTAFYTQYVSDRYSTAVMVTEKAPVYEKPTAEASLVSRAYEGYTFTVDHRHSKSNNGWKYIRMSNGLYGWIPADNILVL